MDYIDIICPICSGKNNELYSHRDHNNVLLNVSICKECGFVFLNPRWTKQSYDNFYRYQYDISYRKSIFNKETNEDKYSNIQKIVKRMDDVKLLPDKVNNILDIGSGMGWALKYLKKSVFKNSNLYSIESSEYCITQLEKSNIEVISKDADSDWHINNKNRFDLIILRHVLEHFLDPISLLTKVSYSLSENGVVYIAVPDAMHPSTPLKKHFFRIVHTFYFSEIHLKNLINLSNLKTLFILANGKNNRHEIYAICTKSSTKSKLIIDPENYRLQKDTFNRLIQKDVKPFYRFKYYCQRKIKLLVPLLKVLGLYNILFKLYGKIKN